MNDRIISRHGIRKSFALAVIAVCAVAPPVLAGNAQNQEARNQDQATPNQDRTSEQPAAVSTITVTGSRIKRSNTETASPVIRISSEQLAATGLKSIGEVLTNLPSIGYVGGGFASSSYSGSGQARVSLYNLGSNRVLVLLNGQRMAAGFGGSVDLNQIPMAAVERIEVLQHGASAVYGSDAIAGVVNIITKKNFSGAAVSAHAGVANGDGNWGGQQQQYSFAWGTSNDRGNIMFTASVRNRTAIPTWERDFSHYNPIIGNTRGSSFTPQGRFIFSPPSGGDPTQPGNAPAAYTGLTLAQCPNQQVQYEGQTLYLPQCDLTIRPGTSGQNPGDYVPFTPHDKYIGADAGRQVHVSSNSDNMLTTNQEIKSFYTQGGLEIMPAVNANFSALYTSRNTHANRVTGLQSVSSQESVIAADNPYNPFDFQLSTNDPVEVAPGVYMPTLTAIYRKMNELGLRNRIHESRTFRFGGGLDGAFEIGESDWDWDAGYIYSTNRIVSAQTNSVSSTAMSLATSPQCSNIPGCVPLNWFGGQGVDGNGSMAPDQLDYISIKHDIFGIQTKHFRSWGANVATSDLFELPAGGLGFAVGVQHRNISGESIPDPSGVTPSVRNSTPSTVLEGSYSVDSAYAEFHVPLLADIPGVERLGVDIASRYAKYSTFGSTTNSRFGLVYQPIGDLLLRASHSEGFRAANLSEMFSPVGTANPYVEDPCDNYTASGVPASVVQNCQAQGVPASYQQSFEQLRARVGGNPEVDPETSVSKTAGIVYSPSWIRGFSINADYYHIALEQTIGSISSQQLFNFCYEGGVQRFCDRIHRAASGFVQRIDNLTTNIGGTTTAGFEVGLYYPFESDFGRFDFMLRGTRVNYYEIETPRGDGTTSVVHVVGDMDNGYIPEWKGNFRASYAKGPWSASVTAHYLGSLTGSCSDYLDGTDLSLTNLGLCSNPDFEDNSMSTYTRPSLTWWDVQVGYDTPWDVELKFGVKNALGEEPAGRRVGFGYVEALDYGVFSRFFYGQISYRFAGNDS